MIIIKKRILIPARGGSKRLPGKNLKVLYGKPMVAWVIEAAQQTPFDVCVSTDDKAIAETAEEFGANVIMRPPELATDEATLDEVALHFVKEVYCDYVLVVQPTAPLLTAADMVAIIAAGVKHKSIVSVYELGLPMWQQCGDGVKSHPKLFVEGCMMGVWSAELFKNKKLLDDNPGFYIVQRPHVDVDTMYDFVKAEALLGLTYA